MAAQDDVEPRVDHEDGAEEDDEGPRSSEAGHRVRDPFAQRGFLLDDVVGIAAGPDPDQLLGGVELAPEDGQHVHARHRLALEQGGDVVPTYLQADGVFEGEGVGLVRCLLQHGGEAKKVAVARLIDEDFLMVFVHRGHAHRPR